MRSLHPLQFWDAPFLPSPRASGNWRPIAAAVRLPLLTRSQLAAQLLACCAFLLEQGFYPSRRLWRGAVFSLDASEPWLMLPALPRFRLEDWSLSRRFHGAEELLPHKLLEPAWRWLLPERQALWREVAAAGNSWELLPALLQALIKKDKSKRVLAHPLGFGRPLWARRFALPAEGGVFYVDSPEFIERLVFSLPGVVGGAWEEGEVEREMAQRTEEREPWWVLTSLPLPGVPPLPLAPGESLWRFRLASEGSEPGWPLPEADPEESRYLLARWAAATGSGREGAKEESFLSPTARRALSLLVGSPMGLTARELERLLPGAQTHVGELIRAGLVVKRWGVWFARQGAGTSTMEKLARLPEGELRGAAARAWVEGKVEELDAACEEALATGCFGQLLALRALAERLPSLRAAVGEAALSLGELELAAPLLAGLEGARGRILRAWWLWLAERRLELEEGAFGSAALPPRLAARALLLRAAEAERQGQREREKNLAQAVLQLGVGSPEVVVLAHFHLHQLAHFSLEGLSGDPLGLAYHLLGIGAFRRGERAQARRLFHQALAAASGENPLLLGEVYADLGALELLAGRTLEADRFLLLAERLLSRAGCRRALQLLRAHRAVLANDLLRYRQAQELLGTTWGEGELGQLADHLEYIRSVLAQGAWREAKGLLAQATEKMAGFGGNELLRQGYAALKAHVALAEGKVKEAESWAKASEEGERELLLSVVRALGGEPPAKGLSPRWGMAVTAQLLFLWRGGKAGEAAAFLAQQLKRRPLEAAVGATRALSLWLSRGGRWPEEIRPLVSEMRRVLQQGELEGWLRQLRGLAGVEWGEVCRALAPIVHGGSEAADPRRWETLLAALGVRGLEVSSPSHLQLRVGEEAGVFRFSVDGFTVSCSEALPADLQAALSLAVRSLTAVPKATIGETGEVRLLGQSPAMEELRQKVARLAPLPVTVLIVGEPGTGKELVARELHRLSQRRGSFVAVNCAGVPETLLEAELFGVVRGAFTGADRDRLGLVEEAEGGTLFLDEVGELPLPLQAKLLRLLQEREVRRVGGTRARRVDVRFVAATNRELLEAVRRGEFRRDLYDRLATVTLSVPPLRARTGDVAILARHLLPVMAHEMGRPGVTLSPEALAKLAAYPWPGNVRELQSVLLRALVGAVPGQRLGPEALVLEETPGQEGGLVPYEEALRAFRRRYFQRLLQAYSGNRRLAAQAAGLSRQSLHYHLRELRLGEE